MFEDYDFPIAALKNSSEVEFLINNVSYSEIQQILLPDQIFLNVTKGLHKSLSKTFLCIVISRVNRYVQQVGLVLLKFLSPKNIAFKTKQKRPHTLIDIPVGMSIASIK